jgi:hypothetical protein
VLDCIVLLVIKGAFVCSFDVLSGNSFISVVFFSLCDKKAYEEGENVLVESKPGQLMWDASISGVSRRRIEGPVTSFLIDAYRVQYIGWSSRFIEWVEPNRVVEPNENNRLLQVRHARLKSG